MILKQKYNRADFLEFLKWFLPDFTKDIRSINFNGLQITKEAFFLGQSTELELEIFEITHFTSSDARVSLATDGFRIMKNRAIYRALVIYCPAKGDDWRLSLMTATLVASEKGKIEQSFSNPRRYSFFLGPESEVHTPNEYLINKKQVKDFEDLQSRFSIEVVNKDFYAEIAGLFTQLAGGKRQIGRKSIDAGQGDLKLPSTNDDRARKEFVVRLIGRLVFCWFLKKKKPDKGLPLLPEELLSSKSVDNNKTYYHMILEPLFFQILNTPFEDRIKEYKGVFWDAIPFLNGGLFNPHEGVRGDFYEPGVMGISKHINNLKIPDSWFKNLFEVFETYNFTIDENTSMDVELSIEPEMLGRIFENLLAEINPETGETARKASGSYYTPRPIVDYMVDESLKQYLLTKTGITEEKISTLFTYNQVSESLIDGDKESIIDALDTIKIIDPACGSGAFPMGILQKMLLILQKIDRNAELWIKKMIKKATDPDVKAMIRAHRDSGLFNYIRKVGIIRDAIYGVDIQPIAVEISKLRFFLSLIVDEKVNDAKYNRGIEPLPNLEFKFVCANSLIGLPKNGQKSDELFEMEDTTSIIKLKQLRDEYLRSWGDEKKKIEKEFLDTQKKMRLHHLNAMIKPQHDLTGKEKKIKEQGEPVYTRMLGEWNPFSEEPCSWFDPDWMFGICDGFDITIGNPPYIQIQNFSGMPQQKEWEKQDYQTYVKTGDVYCLFYEKGYRLLRNSGILTYITSNKWMRANYGKAMRKYLIANGNIAQLIDFGDSPIFENATTYTNVLLWEKIKQNKQTKVWDLSKVYENEVSLSEILQEQGECTSLFGEDSFVVVKSDLTMIKKRIEELGVPLKDWDIAINYGVKTGYNEAFIIDGKKKAELIAEDPKSAEIIKPILRGRDIKKYKVEFVDLWLISTFPALHLNIDDYPAIKKYLKSFGKKLEQSGEEGCRKKTNNKWFEVQDTIAYHEEFQKEKIVYAEIVFDSAFYYDVKFFYPEATTFIMTGERLKFLTAFLNSKLLTFAFKTFYAGGDLRGNTFRYKKVFLENLPVPKLDDKKQKPFIDRMEKILTTKQLDASADVSALEGELDELVYALYNLTKEEIKIVEDGSKTN